MNTIFQTLTQKWYLPILTTLLLGLLPIFTIYIHCQIVYISNIGLTVLSLIFSTSIGIYTLVKNDIKFGIIQTSLSLITGLILIIYLPIVLLLNPYDYFATNLKIPTNIELNIPQIKTEVKNNKNIAYLDSEFENKHKNTKSIDFELFSKKEKGIYYYNVWYKADRKGKLFLKAFELTQNKELSHFPIFHSPIIIDTISNNYKKYYPRRTFIIKEGDKNEFYAARFELWFEPFDKSKSIKLMEKIYKIEGWTK